VECAEHCRTHLSAALLASIRATATQVFALNSKVIKTSYEIKTGADNSIQLPYQWAASSESIDSVHQNQLICTFSAEYMWTLRTLDHVLPHISTSVKIKKEFKVSMQYFRSPFTYGN
jgi:hypothetical protein